MCGGRACVGPSPPACNRACLRHISVPSTLDNMQALRLPGGQRAARAMSSQQQQQQQQPMPVAVHDRARHRMPLWSTVEARPRSTVLAAASAAAGGGADSKPTLTSADIAKITRKSLDELSSKAPKTAKKSAYQGCPGAYSEVASLKACPDFDPLPCEQFETAFQALSQWLCDRAVLPVENSLGGSIHAVYDLMLRYRLHIVGEVSLGINHCLMALPGTKMEDVTRVISHPQALAQCDGYIRRMGMAREAVDDTAGAAQMVADQQLRGTAAIASSRAAELYGLELLEKGIQDDKENVTRFVVLSRDPLITFDGDSTPHKTSIVFSLGDGPGQLFKALAVFALRDLDLLKIESRPLRSNPLLISDDTGMHRFNYLFYVDFTGKLCEERVQNAMRHLQEIAPFVRVLGSFPMDTNLGGTDVQKVLDAWKQTGSPGMSKM